MRVTSMLTFLGENLSICISFLFSRKEISKILGSSYLRGMNMASFFIANKVILFVTFTMYVLLGNEITASRVFVAMTLYGAVRLTVTLFFPSAIERVSEAVISIRRIKVCVKYNCNVGGVFYLVSVSHPVNDKLLVHLKWCIYVLVLGTVC